MWTDRAVKIMTSRTPGVPNLVFEVRLHRAVFAGAMRPDGAKALGTTEFTLRVFS